MAEITAPTEPRAPTQVANSELSDGTNLESELALLGNKVPQSKRANDEGDVD